MLCDVLNSTWCGYTPGQFLGAVTFGLPPALYSQTLIEGNPISELVFPARYKVSMSLGVAKPWLRALGR